MTKIRLVTPQDRKQKVLKDLRNSIQLLDRTKLHLLFYKRNFTLNPYVVTARASYVSKGQEIIDHVGFINHFDYDETRERWTAKTFDATLKHGTIERDFENVASNYHGKTYVVTLDKCDYKKMEEFTRMMEGLPYGEVSAILSAIDGNHFNEFSRKFGLEIDKQNYDKDQLKQVINSSSDTIFCSFVTHLMLNHQGYDLPKGKQVSKEMTPPDIKEIALDHFGGVKQLICYN